MEWEQTTSFDPLSRELADRHYSRQTPGASKFVAPGRCQVLRIMRAGEAKAVWVARLDGFAKHDWPGHLECAMFRNEGAGLSSELIRQAIAAGRYKYGDLPWLTFVKADAVRRKRDPGRCFIKAGFARVGMTKVRNLLAFTLAVSDLPAAAPARRQTLALFT